MKKRRLNTKLLKKLIVKTLCFLFVSFVILSLLKFAQGDVEKQLKQCEIRNTSYEQIRYCKLWILKGI